MRFLSLFSGIEAASVAWHPLGWQCVGVAEIEPFPCKVLAHHYPTVPNLGDITKITQEQIEQLGHIDIVVFGFPCQDLSIAGNRKGLHHADGTATRSGLFFTAMRIVEWSNARWAVAENVPGIFSSKSGGDFAAVVGEMAGCEFDVPRGGWANAGCAVGEDGLVEWVTLDAQFCRTSQHPRAVPQRRRRVFIIRDTGNWSSRAPLFLIAESLRGNPAPRREAGQEFAGTISSRTTGGGGLGTDFDLSGGLQVAGCMTSARMARIGDPTGQDTVITCMAHGQGGAEITEGYAPTLNCNHEQPIALVGTDVHVVAYPIDTQNCTEGHASGGKGFGECGDPSFTLSKGHSHAVAFQSKDSGSDAAIEHSPTICNQHRGVAVASRMQVRRLTPLECERIQGFPDNFTNIPGASDSARYMALGNSMAVNVMQLIGRRIQMVEDIR